MKVLLTGYAGFLGRHLARALHIEGSTVRVLLHRHTVSKSDFVQEADEVIWGSLEDIETIRQAVAGMQAVVHSAWTQTESSREETLVNEKNTTWLVQESTKAGVRSFAFISSVAVYGMRGNSALDESAPYARNSELNYPYPAEKIAVEQMLRSFERRNMKLGIFRPGPIFDEQKGPPKKLLTLGRSVYAIGIGTGKNRMPYIHANDVADAVVRWLQDGTNDAVLNVTPSDCMFSHDWYQQWGRTTGRPVKPIFIRPIVIELLGLGVRMLKKFLAKDSKSDVKYAIASATRNLVYSNEALKQTLGWKDKVTAKFTNHASHLENTER